MCSVSPPKRRGNNHSHQISRFDFIIAVIPSRTHLIVLPNDKPARPAAAPAERGRRQRQVKQGRLIQHPDKLPIVHPRFVLMLRNITMANSNTPELTKTTSNRPNRAAVIVIHAESITAASVSMIITSLPIFCRCTVPLGVNCCLAFSTVKKNSNPSSLSIARSINTDLKPCKYAITILITEPFCDNLAYFYLFTTHRDRMSRIRWWSLSSGKRSYEQNARHHHDNKK